MRFFKGGTVKRVSVATISMLITMFSSTPAIANSDEYWDFSKYADQNRAANVVVHTIGEQGSLGGTTSRISFYPRGGGMPGGDCEYLGQSPCDSNSLASLRYTIFTQTLMPQCQSVASTDCFETLAAFRPDGTKIQGEFIRTVSGVTYPANPRMDFPKTGMQLLYRLPGLNHAGGTDTYAVEYFQSRYYELKSQPRDLELKVSVVPYVEISDSEAATLRKKKSGTSNKFEIEPGGIKPGNIWMEDGKYGKMVNFGELLDLEVSIRASQKFGGWFRGRLDGAVINVKPISTGQQRISVRALAVEVPRLAGVFTEEVWDKYVDLPKSVFNRTKGQAFGGDASDSLGNFKTLEALRVVSNDKAAGSHKVWMFATVPPIVDNKCYKGPGIKGIVSTNAAMYSGSAPRLASGFLDYKVGGLHYLPNGEVAVGSYDLVMRSEVARCLYGFSKAPVSATITIVGDNTQSVATTTVGESNGWLKLSAKGFNFSQKTIKVQLVQSPTTVTCVSNSNPSKIRKITAQNPTCPNGYRVK